LRLTAIITVLVMAPLDASALTVALPVLKSAFQVNLRQVAPCGKIGSRPSPVRRSDQSSNLLGGKLSNECVPQV